MNEKYALKYTTDDIEFISNVIKPSDDYTKYKDYNFQIVSNKNGIDIDRMDYIMRDIYNIGLSYGIESERIMNGSQIINDTIQYSEKIRLPIDDFYRTRYILYTDVYNHHAVRSIEYMIKGILTNVNQIFKFKETIRNKDWIKFNTYTDSIIDSISILKDTIYNTNISTEINNSITIMNNIQNRNIYKLFGELKTNKLISINSKYCIIDTVPIHYLNNIKPKFFHVKRKKYDIEIEDKRTVYIYKLFYNDGISFNESGEIYSELEKKINEQ